MIRRLALALALAALAFPGAALAVAPWTTWTTPDGFKVTIPTSWFLVPNTVSGVDKFIKEAKAENNAAVAQVYASFIATTAERTALTHTAFQAFAYAADPIVPDVTVAVGAANASQTTVSGLGQLAKTLAVSFGSQGWTVAESKVVTLRPGPAAFLNGTYRVGGVNADFAVYVFAHGKDLYELTFHADASASNIKSISKTIGDIADLFAFG